MQVDVFHIIGMALVIALFLGIGVYSGKKVSSAADFLNGGGKASSFLVCGTIMGTLVSGQATIGTAQLAFNYGLSAWWFTLGSGLGCLLLALIYARPMRQSGCTTLVGIITKEYSSKCGYIVSILSAVGIFVSIIAQMLSASALLMTILPVKTITAAVLATGVMAVYVIFGGVWGAGIGGIVKVILLYVASVIAGTIVLMETNGLSGLQTALIQTLIHTDLGTLNGISTPVDLAARFSSLVSRGPLKDLGSALSLILGVLSTQTYASAIWSAKSDRVAKRGALMSAFLIPPIGIMCILIGLFMRSHCMTTAEIATLTAAGSMIPSNIIEIASTAQVFPVFILHYLPKFFGGIVLGTLLITIVGGGAGLALGASTIVTNDILCRLTRKLDTPARKLIVTRVIIVVVLGVAALISVMLPQAVINDFGYLSMGLRGSVAFGPLCAALFLPNRVPTRFAFAAIVAGPVFVLVSNLFLPAAIDPLFPGLAVAVFILFMGLLSGKRSQALSA